MKQTKYTSGEYYILLNYKIKETKSDTSYNKRTYDIPKINIDPKLRLAALSSISDGSSYFKKRLEEIEKTVDSNRVKIESIETNELINLKHHIEHNLESEIQAADKDTDYLINIYNLFGLQDWNQLLDKLLQYIFKYCLDSGININIDFLLDFYKNSNIQPIKKKILTFLKNNNISKYLSDDMLYQYPEFTSNNVSTNESMYDNAYESGINTEENINTDENINKHQITRNVVNNRTLNTNVMFDKVEQVEQIEINTLNNPFITNRTSPLRYIKMMNGFVYLFGILEIGNIESLPQQNEKILFKLSPDCCPKYKINLFITESNNSFSNFGRNAITSAHITVNTNGKVIYNSNDVLNWSTNKIQLYFDGSIII